MIRRINIRTKIAALLCFLMVGGVAFAQDANQKLKKITLVLGGQNSKASYGGFANLKKDEVYYLEGATKNQSEIDIVYTYGSTTGINLMTPSSRGMASFGQRYKNTVVGTWKTRNRGTFLVLRDSKEARKIYRKTKRNDQLVEAYSEAIQTVMLQQDYSKDNHGPSARVQGAQVGDFILFRSRGVKRGVYALGRIVNWEKGYQGQVTIDAKVLSN